jgi:hypothetical protein
MRCQGLWAPCPLGLAQEANRPLRVSEVGDEEVDSVKLAGDANMSYIGVECVNVVIQIDIMSWGSHVVKCVMA